VQPSNRRNPVLLSLALLLLAGLWLGDFASLAANRIVPGQGHGLSDALGLPWALSLSAALLALAALAWRAEPHHLRLAQGLLALLLAQLPLALAWFAARHLDPALPQARIAPGFGVWSQLFIYGLMLIELRQRLGGRLWLIGPLLLLLLSAALIASGAWDSLALMREYAGRSRQFWQALGGHLALVGGTLALSLGLGFALALTIGRWPRTQAALYGLLNLLQTIPSLALFGLLIPVLSYLATQSAALQALGVRGIGWAPALLALVAYSLLPVVRNTEVALQQVDAAVLEAARGMGMSRYQLLTRVRLPLALPVILEGVRITSIQAIGLAAVAALVGAQGFGTFIFQGLGQGAMDLVLLGALPTIALALLADALFGALAHVLTRRRQA
jgi:osmoprotectant transport system permease protein